MPYPKITRLLLTAGLVAGASAARGQAIALFPVAQVYEDDRDRPLKAPEGVACNAEGLVVVADGGNARLVRLSFVDRRVSGGTEVKVAQLPYPVAVQLDRKGNSVVLDRKARKIGRVDPSGAFLGFLEPKGLAEPVIPGAFKLDAAGLPWVLDLAGVRVLGLDAEGSLVRQIPLPREGAVFTDIALDAAGTLYALDAVRSAIWKAEKGATSFKALTPSMKEVLSFPTHLAASRGRLFVTDQNGHGIAVFGIDGSYQGRLLGLGWTEGLTYYPAQLCLNEKEEAFLADRYNNRLQIFTMTAK